MKSSLINSSDKPAETFAVEQTEELYRRAISGVGAVPYSYDFRTRSYLFIGEGIEQLIGYKPNEITPKLWNQITKETVMGGETAGLKKDEAAQRVIKGEIRNWRCDMRVSTRNGESRWISDASVHSFDESGQFTGSIGILQDVTERKRAEVTSTAFSKLGQRLMTAATPQEAAHGIADVADELFGWDACAFYLYFKETNSTYPVLYVDTFEDGRRDVLRPDAFKMVAPSLIDSRVIKNGAELLLKEGPLTMQENSIPYGNTSRPSASIMRVPVRAGSQVVGVLNIHSYTFQAYTRKDLTFLQTLADYCGGALERIWAENALRKSESQFRVVWESSADGMRLTNNEGIVVQVNEAYCRMMQKSKAELEGQPLSIVYHADTAGRILTAYKQRADSKTIESHSEREVTLWNGSKTWFAVSSSQLELPGQPELILSILRDVSGRKQAETELAYERDLLRTLLENSPDQIYFKDEQSRFIKCSNSLSGRLGISPEELIGKTDFDFFAEEHARPALEDERRIMRTGEPVIAKIEKETYKTGTDAWVLTSKMPLRSKAGEIIGTFGISKDITAIKQAEAKLEQVHQQLMDTSRQAGMAEVATSVLHNVGNVLNSVNISSSLASDKIRQSKVSLLANAAALMRAHADDLPGFFATDPKGRQLPGFLGNLADHLAGEQKEVLQELTLLNKNIEHIKEIVAMQQSYAKVSGVLESLPAADLVEDALRMNAGAMERHQVRVIREYTEAPPVLVEKHKVLQ
ncbi:MAG TPA: PAS domain S-box protein, partial [Verrucomicrobiae bacterium]|nr:PAS domain S-box protein [Verrucomicrobiae bacterium]